MALKLDKELITGAIASYWAISNIKLLMRKEQILIPRAENLLDLLPYDVMQDIDSSQLEVVLYGYVSKNKFDAGKSPITAQYFVLDIPADLTKLSKLDDIAYDLIKLQPGWEGATTQS